MGEYVLTSAYFQNRSTIAVYICPHCQITPSYILNSASDRTRALNIDPPRFCSRTSFTLWQRSAALALRSDSPRFVRNKGEDPTFRNVVRVSTGSSGRSSICVHGRLLSKAAYKYGTSFVPYCHYKYGTVPCVHGPCMFRTLITCMLVPTTSNPKFASLPAPVGSDFFITLLLLATLHCAKARFPDWQRICTGFSFCSYRVPTRTQVRAC